MTELERLAESTLPPADDVAALYPVTVNPTPADDSVHAQALEELKFGTTFGDYMGYAKWTEDEGWHDRAVVPYGPIPLEPSAAVLHYGQEIFEGMKAYRWQDGSVWTFRPGFNAARFNHSAWRMGMPQIDVKDFLGAIVQTVRADERWVPSSEDSSLYLRPFMIASEPFLGVRSAAEYLYLMISTPVGPYFKGGLKPVKIWVETEYHRAAPGGTGTAKTGGNYANSLLPQSLAAKKGYAQVCYLDAATNSHLEELGGMNIFVVHADGSVQTPALDGTILEGGTRGAIIQLLADRNVTVEEMPIALADLIADIRSGEVVELFACGTAAVITPIGEIAGEGFTVEVPGGDLTLSIREELSGIQRGILPDRHHWMYQLI